MMFRKSVGAGSPRPKELDPGDDAVPTPPELPTIDQLEEQDSRGGVPPPMGAGFRRHRSWLWTAIPILTAVLIAFLVVVSAGIGIYDGLKDRALANRQSAQEHYALGLQHLEAGDYELAVAELELAQRYESNLPGLQARLQEAKELAQLQVTPTSETRRSAATILYRQAVPYYQSGNLVQAVAILEELRELDAEYQRENVEMMLTTAYFQLALTALQEDRLDDAARRFESVLAIDPEDQKTQDQLNLLNLYTVALSHWEQDWSATIQALKGLYALAPDYKDVRARLHNAYTSRAQQYADEGNWCESSSDLAAAVDIFPLEATVDRRDDAAFRCQATAEAPSPTPTSQATARPTPGATSRPQATATPVAAVGSRGQGRIIYAAFDAARQRHDIFAVDLATGEKTLLRESASQAAASPDSRRLAFHNQDPFHLGLGILDLRTNAVHDLTSHVEDSTPAWSTDGTQILFGSNKHGDRKWRVYAISSNHTRGEGEEWAFGQEPTWSPDGSRVAYHGCDERGDNCGIWVMQAGGFNPIQVTTEASDTAPAWSPDGSQIAFVSARTENCDLFLVDVDTGQERQLTAHDAMELAPVWSPTGRSLAFLSNRDRSWAVWILNVVSGSTQKVIDTGDAYPDPMSEQLSWIP